MGERKCKVPTHLEMLREKALPLAGMNHCGLSSGFSCRLLEELLFTTEFCLELRHPSIEEEKKKESQIKRLIPVLNYRGLLIFH